MQDLAGSPPKIVSDTVAYGQLVLAPDGQSVAASNADGRVAIQPLDGGEPRLVAGSEPMDLAIAWSDDGSLYVIRLRQGPATVYRIDLSSGKRSLWKTFRPESIRGVSDVIDAAMTSDGSAYVYSYWQVTSSVLYQAEGLR